MFIHIRRIPARYWIQMFIIVFTALFLFSFQNCAKTEFTNAKKTQESEGGDSSNNGNSIDITPDPVPVIEGGSGNPKDPNEIISKCRDIEVMGNLLEYTDVLKFDDTRIETGNPQIICDYGNNGNHNRSDYPNSGNNYMVARYEQVRYLQLPVNAELCDVELKVVTLTPSGQTMDAQRLYYDDMFYLSLNNVVLATNHGQSLPNLETQAVSIGPNFTGVQIYLYDWSRLVGKPFSNNNDHNYALGFAENLTTFQWPETQHTGTFQMAFDDEILIHAGSRSPTSTHEFRFAITGDNDATIDCYHSEFYFEIKAKYYIKQP